MRALHLPVAALAVSLLATSGAAGAEVDAGQARPFGERASTVLVVDDLFAYTRLTESRDGPDVAGRTYTTLGNGLGGFQLYGSTTRLGLHFVVGSRVTLGTGIQWYSMKIPGGDGGSRELTLLGISPRLGYVVRVGASSSLWLRAGLGYQTWGEGDGASEWHLPVGAEVRYVSAPFEHFGWTFGPMLEVDLDRGTSTSGTPRKRTLLGLGLGVLFDL